MYSQERGCVNAKIDTSYLPATDLLRNSSAFSKNGAHRKDAPVRSSGPTGQAEIAEAIFLFSVERDGKKHL